VPLPVSPTTFLVAGSTVSTMVGSVGVDDS